MIEFGNEKKPVRAKKSTVLKNVEFASSAIDAVGVESEDSASDVGNPVDTNPPKRIFGTRAPNGTFDRKAYLRQYMAERRAKAKGKKKIGYAGSEE